MDSLTHSRSDHRKITLPRWSRLRECWTLSGENAESRSLLLNRQLLTALRIVVLFTLANSVVVLGLIYQLWPLIASPWLIVWVASCSFAHIGWLSFARRSIRRARAVGPHALTLRTLHIGVAWGSITACTFGVGICLVPPGADGVRPLMDAYVPGLIACGVLVCITTPLISVAWVSILTVATCVSLYASHHVYREFTIALLIMYVLLLLVANLILSRMFVARIEAEMATDRARQFLGLLLGDFEAHARDWLWESTADGILTRAGSRLSEALKCEQADVIGRDISSLFSTERLLVAPSDHDIGVATLRRHLRGNVVFGDVIVEARVDDQVKSWRVSAKPLLSDVGVVVGWRGVGSDSSDIRSREVEAVEREAYFRRLASHDSLTQLPNRRAFLEHMDALAATPQGESASVAVMLVDLDNFKLVNDALGHGNGDIVLKHVAERLPQALFSRDLLARLGGDEFAVLVTHLDRNDPGRDLDIRAAALLQQLRTPVRLKQFEIDVRASIGIAHAAEPAQVHDLMRKADIALYESKAAGRDTHRIYAPAMGDRTAKRLLLVSDLANALQRRELFIEYQSIVDLVSGAVVGCEALLRWRHKDHGLIAPSDFIPVAEESGLIIPIGLWVLQQACQDAARWPRPITLAVNVSAVQLNNASAVRQFVDVILRSGLDTGRVELEITESVMAQNRNVAKVIARELRDFGVRIALDDFGTGYSSMAQLRELPIDKLKLDRSFVAALTGDASKSSLAIISSVLHMARLMSLRVTAEGVETREELHTLKKLGCQTGQGYLFARPMRVERFVDVVDEIHDVDSP